MYRPQVNDFVVLYFRTGQQVSGNVVYWSDNTSEIEAESKSNKIIVNNTLQDILFYKIFKSKKDSKKYIESAHRSDEDFKKLAELKIESNEIEKQEIKEKIFEINKNEVRQISYGLPISALKKPSTKNNTSQEIGRTGLNINRELQNLFSKKEKQ